MALPNGYGDEWVRVPPRMVGLTADLIGGGSREITELTLWSVGDTTYFIWPYKHGVGTT